MTIDELLETLVREYPNGVSLDPMAIRLLRQKISFEDWQIETLKAEMFQLSNELWFSREMITDDGTRLEFRGQATKWLMEFGCFSVERLLDIFCGVLRNIDTPEKFASFLIHLGLTVEMKSKIGLLCFIKPNSIWQQECLKNIANELTERLDEADGVLAFNDIEEMQPQLTAEALEGIRAQFLPDVHVTEVGGVPCWRSAEAVHLPEDFAEKLTTIVDTLFFLGEKISIAKLEFALNLLYRSHFRNEFILPDSDAFMRICAKHYQGVNDVFPKRKYRTAKDTSETIERRSPTRFRDLNIPVGSELFFMEDKAICCFVIDDSNHVEYNGSKWTISALAYNLRGNKPSNGFCFFVYNEETLWDRRLRLEQEGIEFGTQAAVVQPSTQTKKVESEIIGLEGRPLSPSTWRGFRTDGMNQHVAEWARRIANGESVERIAHEAGYAVSTMKGMVSNYHLYFKVCKLNGIVPEGCADV